MGQAVPHQIKRHAHPDVKAHTAAPIEATGIDYLRLIEAAHHGDVGQVINYAALAETGPTRDGLADGEDTTG